MFRATTWLVMLFVGAAAAAPCDAPGEPSVARECQADAAALERRIRTLLETVTEQHPDVRAARRALEERQACLAPASATEVPRVAEVVVDPAARRQAYYGVGGTWPGNVFESPRVTESQWNRLVTLLVRDVGAMAGQAPPILEPRTPGSGRQVEGFSRPLDFGATDMLLREFGKRAPEGVADVFPYVGPNLRFAHPWLQAVRADDRARYLDEIAAKAVAAVRNWEARAGRPPELLQVWNEPIGGNGELAGGTVEELVATMRHLGKRLAQAGYPGVRLVVPAEETPRMSLDIMRAIAADGEALAMVGAFAYHAYPYGSEYAYLPRLLATRAQGREFDQAMRERLALRALSDQLRIPVWMNEVSNAFSRDGPSRRRDIATADNIDWIVGRALHVHDELRYAGVSAFFGMFTVWSDDFERNREPGLPQIRLINEGDSLVLIDMGKDEVFLSGMGHALGHYGRWLRRGARYVDATSSSPWLMASTFVDRGRLVAVLVNAARVPVAVTVRTKGDEMLGVAEGEQSRTGRCRARLEPETPRDGSLHLELPAWSVTTLAVPLAARAP